MRDTSLETSTGATQAVCCLHSNGIGEVVLHRRSLVFCLVGLLFACSATEGTPEPATSDDPGVATSSASAQDSSTKNTSSQGTGSQVSSTQQTTIPAPSGLGDPVVPLAGNQGYDAVMYEWTFSIHPAEGALDAITVMQAVATETADAVVLDFMGPSPEYVAVDGSEVAFVFQPPKLVVLAELEEGQRFALEVRYRGVPEPIRQTGAPTRGWIQRRNHLYTVAALPGDTSSWAPLNDSPLDPAVFSVTIEATPGVTAFASGTRRTSDGSPVWETDFAVSEFGIAIGEFSSQRLVSVASPVVTVAVAAPREASSSTEALEERLPGILAHLESFLGPFPFPTLDLVLVDGLGGGDSKPGLILLGDFNEELLAHELAHQWIGGSTGTASSRDTWLREGIPQYLAYAWAAERSEHSSIEDVMALVHESIGSSTRILTDINDIQDRVDRSNYTRGALAMHALRSAMGDGAFRTALQEFTGSWAGTSATTEDFVATLQQHTEVDLGPVVSAWTEQASVPPLPSGDETN